MATREIIKEGLRVGVMGYGVTGRSAVAYCLAKGAQVMVSDTRGVSELENEYGDYFRAESIEFEGGRHTVEFLERTDLVIVSPGVPVNDPVVQRLKDKGIPVLGELAVTAAELDAPVAAVTGTNGKTTVTSLLAHILKEAGRKVFVGGNIGTPLFDYLLAGKKADYIVLEVSSFQLETAGSFRPDIGILLNVSPDHIDWHDGMEGYIRSKACLFANQDNHDVAVVYGDDPLCCKMAESVKSELLTFGTTNDSSASIEGMIVRTKSGEQQEVYDLAGTELGSVTGARNASAALLAARRFGVEPGQIQAAFASFQLMPHRMQEVAVKDGVAYINDSKATNTGAVRAALEQFNGGVILIAGGKHKGESYDILRETVAQKVKLLILIGESAGKIAADLKGCCQMVHAASMGDAVLKGCEAAVSGDTVLLSPACSSFDMFSSYGHRGEVFTEEVNKLKAEVAGTGATHHA